MSDLRDDLRREFQDKEYRHAYAEENLNTYIATQIKVLREQRGLSQKELAELAGMAQPRIALLEDVNHASWSIKTLRRIARAFDVRLSMKFESFFSLAIEVESFSRQSLERVPFSQENWSQKEGQLVPFLRRSSLVQGAQHLDIRSHNVLIARVSPASYESLQQTRFPPAPAARTLVSGPQVSGGYSYLTSGAARSAGAR